MATERRPGYGRTVGRWEEATRRAEVGKAGSACIIGEREDGLLREARANPAGERVAAVLMSILRPEREEARS